jgi:hypothetical protein
VQRYRRASAIATLNRFRKGISMSEFESKGQRFVALCMFGMLLFNYPILALFNVSGSVLGVPVLYAYIFIAWAALIALMAFIAESGSRE